MTKNKFYNLSNNYLTKISISSLKLNSLPCRDLEPNVQFLFAIDQAWNNERICISDAEGYATHCPDSVASSLCVNCTLLHDTKGHLHERITV